MTPAVGERDRRFQVPEGRTASGYSHPTASQLPLHYSIRDQWKRRKLSVGDIAVEDPFDGPLI